MKTWILILLPLVFFSCGKKEEPEAPIPQKPNPVVIPNYPQEGFYENSSYPVAQISIDSAKRSVDIEIYLMWDKDFLEGINSALNRGVKVRILLDEEASKDCKLLSLPKQDEKQECTDFRNLIDRIRNLGGSVERFSKENLCGKKGSFCHQHGKLMIVDETFALVSSGNFNAPNLCNKKQKLSRCNRDYTYITYDSAVLETLTEVFENDLLGSTYDLKKIVEKPSIEGKLTVGPFSSKPLLDMINSAEKLIQVQNQYLQDPEMNQALILAAQRGVKVELTTASACAFGFPNEKEKEKITRIYSEFDQAGISSRMFTRSMKVGEMPGYLHGKALLVDQSKAWIGSVNGSFTAFHLNREFGVQFEQAKEMQELEQFLVVDHLDPKSVSWQDALRCVNESKDSLLFNYLWN
jgi:cardiolipin synthase A/B